MGYVLCVIISLVIGFFVGLWARGKLKTSSATPGADPMPSEVLIKKEVIEKIVERGIEVHELNKRTDEALKYIAKILEEGSQ